jgi:hypothetical protein
MSCVSDIHTVVHVKNAYQTQVNHVLGLKMMAHKVGIQSSGTTKIPESGL